MTRGFIEFWLRPKLNTSQLEYFFTHTSLLFEFSMKKKYSRSRSTVFSRKTPATAFFILPKSNRRILKRCLATPNFQIAEFLIGPLPRRWHKLMARVEEKRDTVAERCSALPGKPHRNRIYVE